MNARIAMGAFAVVLALTLAGCGDEGPSDIERGKQCAEAGGSWSWDAWAGYLCEFKGQD